MTSLSLEANSIEFEFYSQKVRLSHQAVTAVSLPDSYSKEKILKIYQQMEEDSLHQLWEELHLYRSKFQLNDWLYYLLVRQAATELFPEKSENFRLLFAWYMLLQEGLESRLYYLNDKLRISVYSQDKVHSLPCTKDRDGWWVDISEEKNPLLTQVTALQRVDSPLNKKAMPFRFIMDDLPQFNRKKVERKKLRFEHNSLNYLVETVVDLNMIHLMYNYPDLSLTEHSKIPLSKSAYESVVPAFQRMTRNMTQKEAVSLLLCFLRQSFQYSDDNDLYQANITFSPEETLFYKSSDCEDRSILFQYLLKEVLGLKCLLIRYGNHVTVAVEMDQVYGKPIFRDGTSYSICDPTGPDDNLPIGQLPSYVDPADYEILN